MTQTKNNGLKQWMIRPYPLIQDVKINLGLSFGLSIVSFLFLYIFRPFDLHTVESFTYFIGFGIAVLISSVVHFFLFPKLFKKWFDSDQWKIYNQLLFIGSIVLLIAILNYLYNSSIGKEISPQFSFLEFIFMTSAVAILPILIMTYVIEKVAYKRNQSIAKKIDVIADEINYNNILIQGENQKGDALSIGKDQFLYAQSNQNYTSIYYLFQGGVQHKMIRLSLKNVLTSFSDSTSVFRCHKSYAVNKNHIKEIKGNARSLLIILNHTKSEIPVSRSFDISLLN